MTPPGQRPDHRIGPVTDRLVLRAFEPDDAPAFYRLNTHPDVIRYTHEPPLESEAQARALIEQYPDWERYGYGRWAAIDRASGGVIGFAGLKMLDDIGEVDLGYRFFPEYWGRGLATEASFACLAFGFDVLGLERIIAMADPDNAGSLRVMQKIGMTRVGRVEFDGLEVERYEIERAGYERGPAA